MSLDSLPRRSYDSAELSDAANPGYPVTRLTTRGGVLHFHVALAFDQAFASHAGVTIASVLRHHPTDRVSFLIVHSDLSEDAKKRFRGIASEGGAEIDFVEAEDQVSAYPSFSRFSRAVYLRYLIPSLVGPDTNRVLYLDADVVVMKSLNPLWEVGFEGKVAGAIENINSRHHVARLRLPAARTFYNNGVILFDVAAWRRRGATNRILERIASEGSDLMMPDQDAFNIALGDEILRLPLTWNVQRAVFHSTHRELGISREEHRRVTGDPSILHFTEFSKPWDSTDQHPYGFVYRQLRESTPFADPRIQAARRKRPIVRLATRLKRVMLRISPDLLPTLRAMKVRLQGMVAGGAASAREF